MVVANLPKIIETAGICKAVNFAGVGTMSGFNTIITKRKYDFLNPLNDSIEIEQSKKKLSSKI